jgi:hypothetical protein
LDLKRRGRKDGVTRPDIVRLQPDPRRGNDKNPCRHPWDKRYSRERNKSIPRIRYLLAETSKWKQKEMAEAEQGDCSASAISTLELSYEYFNWRNQAIGKKL